MRYNYVETETAYTILALMCDIGGALGLILGSTMLTFCEFADFLILLAGTWLRLHLPAAFDRRKTDETK